MWFASGFGVQAGEKTAEWAGEHLEDLTHRLEDEIGDVLEIETIHGYAPDIEEPTPLGLFVASVFKKAEQGNWESLAEIENGGGARLVVPSVFALGLAVLVTKRVEHAVKEKGGMTMAQKARLRARLREQYAIAAWEVQEGGEDLTAKTVCTALTREHKNLQVTWSPTTEITDQTRLQVLEGRDLQGKAPEWELEVEQGFPSYVLWGSGDDDEPEA